MEVTALLLILTSNKTLLLHFSFKPQFFILLTEGTDDITDPSSSEMSILFTNHFPKQLLI